MASRNLFAALDSDSEDASSNKKTTTTTKKTTTKPAPKTKGRSVVQSKNGGKPSGQNKGREYNDMNKEVRKPHSGRDTHNHRNPAAQAKKGKREYERRSGTGRGREVKKDGAGSRNWGQAGDEAKDGAAAVTETEKEEAEVVAEPVEPEVPELSMDDYLAMRAAKRTGAAFADKKVLKSTDKVEGAQYTKMSAAELETQSFLQFGKEKIKKNRARKAQKERITEVGIKVESAQAKIDAQYARQGDREDRGDRRGGFRGGRGGRGGRGRGGRTGGNARAPRSAPVNTGDMSAFPAL